jgi:hypothetical protein
MAWGPPHPPECSHSRVCPLQRVGYMSETLKLRNQKTQTSTLKKQRESVDQPEDRESRGGLLG